MVIQGERLDWVGNFNWLLKQDLREFFCYRQHDDTTEPEFLEILLQAADKEPNAAAIYCDCQFVDSNYIEVSPSIKGTSLDRMFKYIERVPLSAAPVRGLIRTAAIRQAGLVRSDEFRAPLEVFVWLAKILRWGSFRRVARPLYYRLDPPRSFTREYLRSPDDRMQTIRTTLFTGLLEATIPLCHTPQQRLFFQQFILERIVATWPSAHPISLEKIVAKCLERLKYEMNTHLLSQKELPQVLQRLNARPSSARSKRYRMHKAIYRIRKRFQMERILYPLSKRQRFIYQIRCLGERGNDRPFRRRGRVRAGPHK